MKISAPTPELPVPNVEAAQAYYRDRLGFEIAWYHADGNIGAVNHGECAIFFRQSDHRPAGGTFWIFAEDVDATYADLLARGADIVSDLANTSWGMRQFTVVDDYGNTFYFHHDL